MSIRTLLAPVIAGAFAVCASTDASAGDLNNWVTIPTPPNITVAPTSRGTTAMFQTTSAVHLFSGITRQWVVVPAQTVDFIEQYHSFIAFQTGTVMHGFGSRQGVDETIALSSPNVSLYHGPINSTWVFIVVDGATAYAFSGFRGKWVPLALSQPNPEVTATGLCGLVKDGSTVWAFGAHEGAWAPVVADPQATLAISVETATAHSPGVFRAFSAHRNQWAVAPFSNTASPILRSGFAMATSSNAAIAFSGLSGTLATYTASTAVGGVTSDAAVAAFDDGADVVCYGAGPGAFAKKAGAAGSIFTTDGDFVILLKVGEVTPFSGVTGAFGATLQGSFSVVTNESIAFADGATVDYAYSPIRNQWIAAPPVSSSGGAALVRSAAVIPHATGYEALSARDGKWVSLATSTANSYDAKRDGGSFVAFDGPNVVHVFDARLGRFATLVDPLPLTTDIFRNTTICHDGQTAWGFGLPTGRWDSVALNSPVTNLVVKTSIAVLETQTDIHVYSAKGSLSQEGRYPEFFLAIQLGDTLRLHQVGPPGSALVMFVGAAPAHFELGLLLGNFDIDPSNLLSFPLATTIPANGLLEIDLPLPQAPILVGVQPHIQNAVLPPSGTPYLSTSVSPVLY